MTDRMTVFSCWAKARREHPDDLDKQRFRYIELLREQGHVVKRKPGESVNLPCGWPHRAEPDDVTHFGSRDGSDG